jgi:CheY-like chemotaxis protein
MNTTVLVAESDAGLRDVYKKFLGGRDFDVQTAACGLECLEKLRQELPDVLVLDLALPWGGGDGVLAWLCEEGLQSEVAVVLMSTSGGRQEAPQSTQAPVVESLAKPFTLAALLQSVFTAAKEGEGPLFDQGRGRTVPEFFVS